MSDQTGIPPSIGEVRLVLQEHKMDAYHRFLMTWLADRVERLQEENQELQDNLNAPNDW